MPSTSGRGSACLPPCIPPSGRTGRSPRPTLREGGPSPQVVFQASSRISDTAAPSAWISRGPCRQLRRAPAARPYPAWRSGDLSRGGIARLRLLAASQRGSDIAERTDVHPFLEDRHRRPRSLAIACRGSRHRRHAVGEAAARHAPQLLEVAVARSESARSPSNRRRAQASSPWRSRRREPSCWRPEKWASPTMTG